MVSINTIKKITIRNEDMLNKVRTKHKDIIISKKRILFASPHMSGHEMDLVEDGFNTNWIGLIRSQ